MKKDNGEIVFSAKFFDKQGKTICEIVKNKFHLNRNNAFRIEHADNRLVVFNDESRRIVDVEYINPRAVRITGAFHLRDGASISIGDEFAIENATSVLKFVKPIVLIGTNDESGLNFSIPKDGTITAKLGHAIFTKHCIFSNDKTREVISERGSRPKTMNPESLKELTQVFSAWHPRSVIVNISIYKDDDDKIGEELADALFESGLLLSWGYAEGKGIAEHRGIFVQQSRENPSPYARKIAVALRDAGLSDVSLGYFTNDSLPEGVQAIVWVHRNEERSWQEVEREKKNPQVQNLEGETEQRTND